MLFNQLHASTLDVYDIRPSIACTCSKLLATFALFPVLSRGYAHAQLSSLYLYRFSHDKKYQALHACTTSMFAFWSVGAWVRGYVHVNVLCSITCHLFSAVLLCVARQCPHQRRKPMRLWESWMWTMCLSYSGDSQDMPLMVGCHGDLFWV